MKVFLMTDLEGICGVDSIDMIDEATPGYCRAQELLMQETNAAVAGAVRAGAETILVFDGHGGGHNFLPGRLDARATQVHSLSAEILAGAGAFLAVGCHEKLDRVLENEHKLQKALAELNAGQPAPAEHPQKQPSDVPAEKL